MRPGGGIVHPPIRDHRIVIAGAGYAGLHAALRLATRRRDDPGVELTLVDRCHDHRALTELPRVAAGTRAAGDVALVVDPRSGRPLPPLAQVALEDAVEWEYRQSVKHLRGWDPLAL
jgi:NADH dehydrogenase FAD-containing subunit